MTTLLCTDLDGPIINCEERYHRVYCDCVREFGGNALEQPKYWSLKRQRVKEADILRLSGVDESGLEPCNALRIARIEQKEYLAVDTLQKDILAILAGLRPLFSGLFCITLRKNETALREQLRSLGIDRCFDAVLTGYNETEPGWKIKADLLRRHIGMTARIDGGWFVGDTETDLLAGRALGLQTAAMINGIRTEEYLRSRTPDLVVASLQEFAEHVRTGATYL